LRPYSLGFPTLRRVMMTVCSSKQAQDLLCGRDLLLSENAAKRLIDALLNQGNEVVELVRQTVGTRIWLLS
jgi:hypothetical protein